MGTSSLDLKRCPRCKTEKPLDEFGRHRSTKDGKACYCRPCAVANQTESRIRLGWVRRVPMTHEEELRGRRERRLLKEYGITQEQFDAMLVKQKGGCALCGDTKTGRWGTLHIDHNHETGEVRGLLCTGCNRAIGYINDNAEIARKMARYLGGKRA